MRYPIDVISMCFQHMMTRKWQLVGLLFGLGLWAGQASPLTQRPSPGRPVAAAQWPA